MAVLICLASFSFGDAGESEVSGGSDDLTPLLLALNPAAAARARRTSDVSMILGGRKSAPKKTVSKKPVAVRTVSAPKKTAPKKTVSKEPVASKKIAPKKMGPKKTGPKVSEQEARKKVETRMKDKALNRVTFPPQKTTQAQKNLLFDVRELGGLVDDKANLFGFTNVDPQGLGYFDPLGLTIGASEAKIRTFREAELKHARIAMLAALGFVVGENYHPVFDGQIEGASVYALQKTLELVPEYFGSATFLGLPLALVIALEFSELGSIFGVGDSFDVTDNSAKKLDTDYTVGEYPRGNTWDPLKLSPKDPAEFREMQNRELNNGRVAMIAAMLFFFQEQKTGVPIFR